MPIAGCDGGDDDGDGGYDVGLRARFAAQASQGFGAACLSVSLCGGW
jgi:hypothetical protein